MPGCRGSGGGVSVLVKQSRLMSSPRKYTIQINHKSIAVKYIPSARQPLQAVLSTMIPVTSVNQDYLQSVIQFELDRTEICSRRRGLMFSGDWKMFLDSAR